MRLLTETLSLLCIEIHKGGEQLAGWLDGRVDTSVGHVGGVLEQNVQLHRQKTGVRYHVNGTQTTKARYIPSLRDTEVRPMVMPILHIQKIRMRYHHVVGIQTIHKVHTWSLVVEEDQWKVEPLGHSHISPGGWIIEIHHRSVGLLL